MYLSFIISVLEVKSLHLSQQTWEYREICILHRVLCVREGLTSETYITSETIQAMKLGGWL